MRRAVRAPGVAFVNVHLRKLAALLPLLEPRVLVRLHGSGNHGEQSESAAFYTLDKLPAALLRPPALPKPPQRRDIDLGPGGLAFVIDGILTPEEADVLAACSEAIFDFNGHTRIAPGITTPPGMRVNMAAHWFPRRAEAGEFFGPFYERFRHLLPVEISGRPLFDRLNEKIATFKYSDGDEFKPHSDGVFPGQGASTDDAGVDAWDGVDSGLSMLVYLNDGETDGLQGGETRLFRMDRRGHVDVTPRKGSALFFRHGSGPDSVLHASLPVIGDVPKYLARMNVLYGVLQGAQRLY